MQGSGHWPASQSGPIPNRLHPGDGADTDSGGKYLLLLIALSVLAALLLLLRQINYGIGLEPDSIGYLSAARNLAAGNGLVMANGAPLAVWAPLFPVLAAVPGLVGLDALPAASLVNAGAIGGLVFVAGWRLRRSCGATLPAVWGTLAVMLSVPINRQGYLAVSEPVFLLFMMLALVQAERFLDDGRRAALVWAGVFTALACLTRYIGVAIIMTVVLLLLVNSGRLTEKAKNVTLYAVIPVAALSAWMVRNLLITGFWDGGRPASDKTLGQNLSATAEVLASWLLPGAWPDWNPLFATLLALLALTPAVGAGILAVRYYREHGRLSGVLTAPAAFMLIYIALLVVSGSITLLAKLDYRLLAPVYAPLIFTVAGMAAWWLRRNAAGPASGGVGREGHGWRRGMPQMQTALRMAPIIGLFLWLAYPLAVNAVDTYRAINHGTGRYSYARWVDSDLLKYMEHNLAGLDYGRLYSNSEQLPYFYAGIPAVLLPFDRNDLYRIYQSRAATDGIYVAWFVDELYHQSYRRGYGKDELVESLPAAQVVFESGHGTLFYVGPENIRRYFHDAISEIGAPAASALYNVYLGDNRLLYIKEPCAAVDTAALFYLHIVPERIDDLPRDRQGYGFDNRDFAFDRFGLRSDDACLISVPLPEWDFTDIRTGQYTDAGRLWESEFPAGGR